MLAVLCWAATRAVVLCTLELIQLICIVRGLGVQFGSDLCLCLSKMNSMQCAVLLQLDLKTRQPMRSAYLSTRQVSRLESLRITCAACDSRSRFAYSRLARLCVAASNQLSSIGFIAQSCACCKICMELTNASKSTQGRPAVWGCHRLGL